MTAPLDDANAFAASTSPNANASDAPPRPVWATLTPEAPWCPPEWESVLERVVPHWNARTTAAQWDDVPDAIGVSARTAAWSVVGAARRGRLHAHRGDFREDAIDVRQRADGWCGAVADGAGSAAWSRIGSTVATHTFCAVAADSDGDTATRARRASEAVFATLRALATALEIAPRTLRTTLLAAVADARTTTCVQVGDGGIALARADGSVITPQIGDAGEFSGDVTLFLPDDGSDDRLLASLLSFDSATVRGILLATDGIEDPFYPLHRHAAVIAQMIGEGVSDAIANDVAAASSVQLAFRGAIAGASDPARALLEWMAFEKRGENDDRALLYVRSLARP